MTTPMIFSSILVMGLTCSLGCGSVNTPFILGSLLGDSLDIKLSRKAITLFSIGKITSLCILGLLSAIFGSIILEAIETSYPNSTIWIVRFVTFFFGARILYTVFRKNPCSSCSSCSSCKSANPPTIEKKGSYLVAGALYATIPCAPLITTLTYASTMTPILAVLLLLMFGIVNSVLPVIVYASMVGLANNEFLKEMPKYIDYIKVVGGIVLMYAAFFQV